MEHVLLICGAGASSSFLAQAIRKAAKKRHIELTCNATSEAQLNQYVDKISILLLGPHLAYLEDSIRKETAAYPIKVALLTKEIYGMLDGEKALDLILSLTDKET